MPAAHNDCDDINNKTVKIIRMAFDFCSNLTLLYAPYLEQIKVIFKKFGGLVQYLHTMVRVTDLSASLRFYCDGLGLKEIRRYDSDQGRFTLVFLAAPDDLSSAQQHKAPLIELTYNWDPEEYTGGRNFGHLAYRVNDIYGLCDHLQRLGVTINRPPRDGHMAFVRSPDGISVELLQAGDALAPAEPWISMANTGTW